MTSWADMSDDENCYKIVPKTSVVNQWDKPLVIDKSLLEKTKENIDIQCRDCKNIFVWDIKEQYFYENKGYSPPKTCKKCKKIRNTMGPPPRIGRKKILNL